MTGTMHPAQCLIIQTNEIANACIHSQSQTNNLKQTPEEYNQNNCDGEEEPIKNEYESSYSSISSDFCIA